MSLLLSKRWGWVFPLLCIIVLIPISNAYDVALSQLFYRPEIKKFTNTEFLSIVYRYAQLPALLTGIAAGLLWFAAPLLPKIKRYRPYLAVLALTLALGPGLLVNVVLKPNWGRPRPRHVIELGGEAEFRPFYSPNWGPWKRDFYKSMPSGHASMGFYFLALVVIGYRMHKKWVMVLGGLLTVVLSFCLGWARISQGGHFLSDVLMAGVVVWAVVLFLDRMFLSEEPDTQTT